MVESRLWRPLTARLISEMLLRKTVLGNERVVPRPFLIHHSTQERLANSQIHSFKKISIWKVAKGKKNCNFLEFLELLEISLRVGYCWIACSFLYNLVKTVYLKVFLFIPHINSKSAYTAFFSLQIFIKFPIYL